MDNQPEKSTKQGNPAIWVVLVIVLVLTLGGAYFLFFQENEDANVNNANAVANQNVNVANTNTAANENVNTITSDIDTSDWVTYENEEYGFQVKHPANWDQGTSKVDRENFQYTSFNFSPKGNSNASYQINVYDSLSDLANGGQYNSLADWIAAQEDGSYFYPPTNYLGISGYEGYWPSSDTTYSFFLENNGTIYNIDITWFYPETREKDQESGRPIFTDEEKVFLSSFEIR